MGGATINTDFRTGIIFISIHAPRGGSDLLTMLENAAAEIISIHAPRGGSDAIVQPSAGDYYISIHAPRGGSDQPEELRRRRIRISIHAPRGGSDIIVNVN